MKKAVAGLLLSVMFFTYVGSAQANGSDIKVAIDKVVGTPYKWGGTTIKGFDCSGFILYIFDQYDVKLDLNPGDLVFFNTDGKGVSHAGIFIGNGQFAHSSSSKGVRINKLSDDYYEKRYVTARRIVSDDVYTEMTSKDHS